MTKRSLFRALGALLAGMAVLFAFDSCADFSGGKGTGSVSITLGKDFISAVSKANRSAVPLASEDDVAADSAAVAEEPVAVSEDEPSNVAMDEPDSEDTNPYSGEKILLNLALRGDYTDFLSEEYVSGESKTLTFTDIPVGSTISVVADVYQGELHLMTGTSSAVTISSGANEVRLEVHWLPMFSVFMTSEDEISDVESVALYAIPTGSELAKNLLALAKSFDAESIIEALEATAPTATYTAWNSDRIYDRLNLAVGDKIYLLSVVRTKNTAYLGYADADDFSTTGFTVTANENRVELVLVEAVSYFSLRFEFYLWSEDSKSYAQSDDFPPLEFGMDELEIDIDEDEAEDASSEDVSMKDDSADSEVSGWLGQLWERMAAIKGAGYTLDHTEPDVLDGNGKFSDDFSENLNFEDGAYVVKCYFDIAAHDDDSVPLNGTISVPETTLTVAVSSTNENSTNGVLTVSSEKTLQFVATYDDSSNATNVTWTFALSYGLTSIPSEYYTADTIKGTFTLNADKSLPAPATGTYYWLTVIATSSDNKLSGNATYKIAVE